MNESPFEVERNVLSLNDTPLEIFSKMSGGNPGALTVLMNLVKSFGDQGYLAIMHLDDMQLRAHKIWVAFKDHCKSDLDKFYQCVISRDKDMLKTVDDCENGVLHAG